MNSREGDEPQGALGWTRADAAGVPRCGLLTLNEAW
jgi:hypothetical protein